MSSVCPRSTGRHPMRRKKNCVLLGLAVVTLLLFVQMSQYNDGYTPLLPLSDAKSEAKRLLKFITHYHVQCNTTLQIGNRSHWPICIERELGLDLDIKDNKVAYSIGVPGGDYLVERDLAQNHSFEVVLITHDKVPSQFAAVNNTRVIETVVVPNDPADFSRNLYGQQTVNDIQSSLGHPRVDLLKLASTVNPAHMWEVLHFMIEDNLLLNVQQLHVAMYIDKLDDDFLYNWYRVLYNLFYKQGLRLYHTSSADSLCLQVTMMESCIYYMAFVKNPGTRVFVLHPPADYGTAELEEERLLSYLSEVETECKQQIIGGPGDQETLHFTTPSQPQWPVCANGVYELFPKPCSVVRFRLGNDHSLEQKFIQEGCSVHTVEPIVSSSQHEWPVRQYKIHGHYPKSHTNRKSPVSEERSADGLVSFLSQHGAISLLELDVPGYEWEVLGPLLLDTGVLHNVTQMVAWLHLPHPLYGRHATVLRSRYSQLRRIHTLGFRIFHSSAVESSPLLRWTSSSSSLKQHTGSKIGAQANYGSLGPDCCFKVGFVKRPEWGR